MGPSSYHDPTQVKVTQKGWKRLFLAVTSNRVSRIVLILVLIALVGSSYILSLAVKENLSRPKSKVFSTKKFKEVYEEENTPLYIVDIREEESYKENHIPGSYSIPTNIAYEQSFYFPKNITVVLYGDDINGTKELGDQLLEDGVEEVYIIKEGFEEWNKKGYEVEQTPGIVEAL